MMVFEPATPKNASLGELMVDDKRRQLSVHMTQLGRKPYAFSENFRHSRLNSVEVLEILRLSLLVASHSKATPKYQHF
jgi:hypothetical protein